MKRRLLCVFLIPATFATIGLTQEKKASPHYLPGGGAADPADKVGFFPNPTGGIDALDLATGKLLWSAIDANRPLVATADRLFAQAGTSNQVRILVFDTTKEGKLAVESQAIKLADWASVQTAYGRSFRSSAKVEGNALYLSWEARAFYAGGARPTPQIEKAARKEASGAARVDLDSGKVEALDPDQAAKFPVTGESINPKVGTLTLTMIDGVAKNAKGPFERRRTLRAVNEAKEVVWERDIKAPVFLPPRP